MGLIASLLFFLELEKHFALCFDPFCPSSLAAAPIFSDTTFLLRASMRLMTLRSGSLASPLGRVIPACFFFEHFDHRSLIVIDKPGRLKIFNLSSASCQCVNQLSTKTADPKVRWQRCGLAAELPARATPMNKLLVDWDILHETIVEAVRVACR